MNESTFNSYYLILWSRILPWLVCCAAGMFFFYEFIQLNVFNTISKELIENFHLSPKQLGIFSSCYFYAQIIFILPAGLILDKFSVKKTVMLALSLCIVSTYWLSTTNNNTVAFVMRFFVGFGSAFCFLSCLKLINRWIPAKWTAFATGLVVTMAMLGGLVAQTPASILFNYVGWRTGLKLDVLLGIIILFLITIFVKDYPTNYKSYNHTNEYLSLKNSILTIASKKENWLYGTYTCFMNLPIFVFGALWGNSYLINVNHLMPTPASLVVSMILFGTIVGAPVLGFISDKLNKHKNIMLWSSVFCLLLSIIIFFQTNASINKLMLYFFVLGFLSSAQCISYPMMMKITPSFLTCTAIAFTGLIIMLGGGLLQPLWGIIVENGIFFIKSSYYSNQHLAFFVLIMGFLFAIAISAYLKEKT